MIKGFTLIELLIVIVILAVLAASVTVILNPGELLAQARDSRRVGELNSLTQAIGLHAGSVIGGYRGTANRVYISLPYNSVNCGTLTTSLPAIPIGWEYRCVTVANLQRSDGAGWLPHNFNAMRGGSPFNQLPIDPINNTSHYYAYITGTGFVLSSLLESNRHLQSHALKDGGTDPGRLELGTNLGLWTSASRLVSYWPLDGDFRDAVGTNHGTQSGGVTFAPGRQNQAGNFDGANDFVNVGIGTNYFPLPFFTKCAWARSSGLAPGMTINGIFSMTFGLTMFLNNEGRYFFRMHDGITFRNILGTNNLHNNEWHYLCATFDGAHARIFINGIINISPLAVSWPGTTNWPTSAVRIGHEINNTPHMFNGLIDEVRIYNRALSPAEIQAIFNATR